MTPRVDVPLQLEVAKILLHDSRHGHSQCGGKILQSHGPQIVGTQQETSQALS
jgi:hypothetical protein